MGVFGWCCDVATKEDMQKDPVVLMVVGQEMEHCFCRLRIQAGMLDDASMFASNHMISPNRVGIWLPAGLHVSSRILCTHTMLYASQQLEL